MHCVVVCGAITVYFAIPSMMRNRLQFAFPAQFHICSGAKSVLRVQYLELLGLAEMFFPTRAAHTPHTTMC